MGAKTKFPHSFIMLSDADIAARQRLVPDHRGNFPETGENA
jgi:hypothetical protein